MKLWIRSQDKTRLSKITQVKFVDKESDLDDFENVIRGYGIDGYNFRLGIYKSKERALEVLDEIQNILILKDMYKYDRELVLKSWENVDEEQVKIVRKQMSVYEMPKE